MSERSRSDARDNVVGLSSADARELARLVALLLRDVPTAEAQAILRGKSGETNPELLSDREQLVSRARTIFSERRRRMEFLLRNLFNEPGWDMLLAVYITDFTGGRQTVGKLSSWIGAPATTAIRWIDYLENHRLVARQDNPDNRRIVFVDLTDKGRDLLDSYFATMAEPIAFPKHCS